ncbi:MAG: phosphatidylserine decarboxylase [Gammaproteobacteria bacterium]|nr:phosphatidylserine decarboxylase [Gammaproteobacteria bacterium]MBU1655421.1 phosphatidylserine decarboxylase [Gammaproteobacteria bacterium]MBU1961054.1 phosphatidylserine decarboxylase [Gammaproteobacteria bacterium]
MNNPLADRLFVLLLQLLPHHLLSRGMRWLTRCEWAPLKDWVIRRFIRLFRIDLEQAAEPDPSAYPSINAFFTRTLKADARPLCAEGQVALPADGKISAFGTINQGRLIQAKGMDYSLADLVGGDPAIARLFEDGTFATIYLSPRDYHRVHMPLSGKLRQMSHVPGRLFSVNAATARTLPRLFTRNERVVCLFDTEAGPMAVILVGAIFVGCMDTLWAGTIAPADLRTSSWHYGGAEQAVTLEKGAEMGRFNMGSTVILLFGKDALAWHERIEVGLEVRMGEALGSLK